MKTYTFNKEGLNWYIDLPEFIAQGGHKGDLQMVEGADTMLEMMTQNGTSVILTIDVNPFPGADELIFKQLREPEIGGAYYTMHKFEGNAINLTMWLCSVTEFVFGELPKRIFLKREKLH